MMIALLCVVVLDAKGAHNDCNLKMIQHEAIIMVEKICNGSIHHSIKFKEQKNVVVGLSTHAVRRILKSNREDD